MAQYNNHIDLTIAPREACANGQGPFIANAYYLPSTVQCRSLTIGSEPPKDVPSLFDNVNKQLNVSGPIGGPWKAAAILLTRFCTLEHPSERKPDLAGNRIEIVNAYIAADPDTTHIDVPVLRARTSHGDVKAHGSDTERRRYPLIIPTAEGMPPPSEIVAVPVAERQYFYIALHAGFEQLVGIDPGKSQP